MTSNLTYGSLFAGIGGFDKGFHDAGVSCRWQVELSADCRSVLGRHFPDAERHINVTEVGKTNLERVDIICGGWPCQDLSVAGKRAGLEGERSGLFYELARVVDELKPMFLVWENVPGLLSSGDGRDFARVLRTLDDIGYSGAWTGLDAQWFGVAQRRRRIFGVFAQRDIGAASCAEILSLSEGLRRDSPTRRKAREGVTGSVAASLTANYGKQLDNSDRNGGPPNLISEWPAEVAPPLDGSWSDRHPGSTNQEWIAQKGGRFVPDHQSVIGFDKGRGVDAGDIAAPLRVNGAQSEGVNGGKPDNQCVMIAANNFGERDISTSLSARNERIDGDTETFVVAPCLRSNYRNNSDPTMEAQMLVVPFDTTQITSNGNYSNPNAGDPCHPLAKGAHPPAIAKALRAGASHSHQGVGVRRLTPVECERLQGFPDGWTEYGSDGKRMGDSVRYRMLGNAVCVNVARWIGHRIIQQANT